MMKKKKLFSTDNYRKLLTRLKNLKYKSAVTCFKVKYSIIASTKNNTWKPLFKIMPKCLSNQPSFSTGMTLSTKTTATSMLTTILTFLLLLDSPMEGSWLHILKTPSVLTLLQHKTAYFSPWLIEEHSTCFKERDQWLMTHSSSFSEILSSDLRRENLNFSQTWELETGTLMLKDASTQLWQETPLVTQIW